MEILPYAAKEPTSFGRFIQGARRRMSRIRTVVFALAAVGLLLGVKLLFDPLAHNIVWYINYGQLIEQALFLGVIFLAGAFKKLNWRHSLLMLGLFALFLGWLYVAGRWFPRVFGLGYHPYRWLLTGSVPLLLLGLGIALTAGWRSVWMIVWVTLAATAISAVSETTLNVLPFYERDFEIKARGGWSTPCSSC